MKKAISCAIALSLITTIAQGQIESKVCIQDIGNILELVPQGKNIVAVFDWDQTISSKEGNYTPRENHKTLETIAALQRQGIKTMVLTARGIGLGTSGGKATQGKRKVSMTQEAMGVWFDDNIKKMMETLGETEWLSHGALKNDAREEMALMEESSEASAAFISAASGSGRELKAVIEKQVVFAGGDHVKGEALLNLINQNKFKENPDYILFIDNAKYNIDNVEEVFKERPEKVILVFYPSPLEFPQGCQGFEKEFSNLKKAS